MGYGAVVALVTALRLAWNAETDRRLLRTMSRINGGLLVAYLALRLGDVALSGKLGLLRLDLFGVLFVFEIALFAAAAARLLSPSVLANRGRMFGAALLALSAGAIYRVDTYLTVYRPGPGWNYFPSLGELVVTVGMAAAGIALFITLAKLFPVVAVEEAGGRKSGEVARAG
jgi:Ni/Fe-hydrogenase subunit HybB-like protein